MDPTLDPRKAHARIDDDIVKLSIPLGSNGKSKDLNNLTPDETAFYREGNINDVIHEVFHRGFSDLSLHQDVAKAIMAVIPPGSSESTRLGLSPENRKSIRKDDGKSASLIDAPIREYCPSS